MNNKFSSFHGNDSIIGISRDNSSVDHIINKLGLTNFKTPTEDTIISAEDMKLIIRDLSYIQSILGTIKGEIIKNK